MACDLFFNLWFVSYLLVMFPKQTLHFPRIVPQTAKFGKTSLSGKTLAVGENGTKITFTEWEDVSSNNEDDESSTVIFSVAEFFAPATGTLAPLKYQGKGYRVRTSSDSRLRSHFALLGRSYFFGCLRH